MLIAISIFCLALTNIVQSILFYKNNKDNNELARENLNYAHRMTAVQEKNYTLNERATEFNRQVTFANEERAKEIHEATIAQVKKGKLQLLVSNSEM
jgi:hypothetical protein